MKVIPIIPAYNPTDKLIFLVKELISSGYKKIIVVNDGSNNHEIFDKVVIYPEVILLEHEINKGKGVALKNAFKYYKDNLINDYKGVVTIDADGQHKVSDAINISNLLVDNGLFILGTRLFDKNVPFRNKFGNRLTSFTFKKLYGTYLKDTQTGLRGIPNSLIDLHLSASGERFEYELNALIDLIKDYQKIIQVNIETVYLDDSNKHSNFKVIKDSFKIYKILFKRRKK